MNSDTLKPHMPLITSIISSAEDRIFSATGLQVKLSVQGTLNAAQGKMFVAQDLSIKCCELWGIDISILLEKSRKSNVVIMRSLAVHLIRHKYKHIGLRELGDFFGGYDHTSMIACVERVNSWLFTRDVYTLEYYNKIKHLYEASQL